MLPITLLFAVVLMVGLAMGMSSGSDTRPATPERRERAERQGERMIVHTQNMLPVVGMPPALTMPVARDLTPMSPITNMPLPMRREPPRALVSALPAAPIRMEPVAIPRPQTPVLRPVLQAALGPSAPALLGPGVNLRPLGKTLPFQEAHWQGIETVALSPALAQVLKLPVGVQGVVIDEVTMPADMQGFAGGDLIVAVGGVPTPTLNAFIAAADQVRDNSQVAIQVQRTTGITDVILSAPRLGTANGETAPAIPPGARMPHTFQGPCTNCHRIGTGVNMPVDLGNLLMNSAPIIAVGAIRPHRDRGPCSACHVIR